MAAVNSCVSLCLIATWQSATAPQELLLRMARLVRVRYLIQIVIAKSVMKSWVQLPAKSVLCKLLYLFVVSSGVINDNAQFFKRIN